jgi:hypothetical protein
VQTGDQQVAATLERAHDDGLEQALIGHGLGEGIDFVRPERPKTAYRDRDVAEGDRFGLSRGSPPRRRQARGDSGGPLGSLGGDGPRSRFTSRVWSPHLAASMAAA